PSWPGAGAPRLDQAISSAAPRSWAPRRKLVLEAQKVEEIESARAVAIGVSQAATERILEAQEVEEIEFAGFIAVGVASGATGAAGQAARRLTAQGVEAAATPQVAIDHFEAEDAVVGAAADDFPRPARELQWAAGARSADVDGRAGSIVEDGVGGNPT